MNRTGFRLFGSKPLQEPSELFFTAIDNANIPEIKKYLKQRKFKINQLDSNGNTAVHRALFKHCSLREPEANKYIEVMIQLGTHKADFNIVNNSGFLPMEIAHLEYSKDRITVHMLKLLRCYGATR